MKIYNGLVLGIGLMVCGACASPTTEKRTNSDFVPEGYQLVWNDEFESHRSGLPDSTKWMYDLGGGGWGNKELQYYAAGYHRTDTVAKVDQDMLHLVAYRLHEPVDGHSYLSARMKTRESWLYGYFEARMKLPKGCGTWPAFWMLPEKFKEWPLDGEIDIMEHVGSSPDSVLISTHTLQFNHARGTQKTSVTHVPHAQDTFHVYGLEWTKDSICGYIDGKQCFQFFNDGKQDRSSWPFYTPFRLILNQAVGGMLGGKKGIDDTSYPADFQVDYVRVYQKILNRPQVL